MQILYYLFLVYLLAKNVKCVDEAEVKILGNFLQENIQKAQTFVLPKKSNFSSTGKTIFYGHIDFIIVGAGATGTVLANRLSENKKWKILLIEAGEYGNNLTAVPAMIHYSHFSEYNWGYMSVPQNHSCLGMKDNSCRYPRGKGVGGTTLINGVMYSRGNPIDFDKWSEMGLAGWSYKEVLPYFKKSENYNKNDPEAVVDFKFHGKGGPLNVEYNPVDNPHIRAFYESNKELGYNLTDVNGPNQIGVSPIPFNKISGKRLDGGNAFVKPILNRKNLVVITKALATKIDISSKKANGVFFTHDGQSFYARANKEVIVSAGALNSPQLLMLSGIGPKNHLKEMKIELIENLEVGSVLREHPMLFGLNFETNHTEPVKSFEENVRDFLNNKGPLRLAASISALGFYQTEIEKTSNYPDLEIMFVGSCSNSEFAKKVFNWKEETWNSLFEGINPASCIGMLPIVLHARSSGSLRLKSNNPYDYPLIDPNHLGDSKKEDMQIMYSAIKYILELTETKAFKKLDAKLFGKPLPACKDHKYMTEEYWYCFIGQMTYNVYHPVGSCPMGPSSQKGTVVDHELRVHGIKKLRVADASVFPFTLSGHPNAPCVMIGEKLADLLKIKYIKACHND